MKLKDSSDKYSLLTEINRLDLVGSESIPDDVFELFIKQRRNRVNKLKNFRRSQNTKSAWRKNRFSYLKGIKKFHRSIKGKRMHRSMGRFLALRHFPSKRPARESLERVKDLVLKASSSIRTHMYIEEGYYMSLDSQIELELLAEYILPILQGVEANLYEDICYDMTEDELECILRIIDEDELLKALTEVSGIGLVSVKESWHRTQVKEVENGSTYLTSRFKKLIEDLRGKKH
jgi:hypothetical protein